MEVGRRRRAVDLKSQQSHLVVHSLLNGQPVQRIRGRSLSVCQSVCHLVSPAKTAVAIKMSFASTILVGTGKHLLHIADRFWRILYSVHSTQYSLQVIY